MKKERILIILGFLVLLSPFYGLPQAVMTITMVAIGALIIAFSLSLHMRSQPKEEEKSDTATLP